MTALADRSETELARAAGGKAFALGGCRIRASFLRCSGRQVTLAAEGDDRRATLLWSEPALCSSVISLCQILLFLLGGSFLCRD